MVILSLTNLSNSALREITCSELISVVLAQPLLFTVGEQLSFLAIDSRLAIFWPLFGLPYRPTSFMSQAIANPDATNWFVPFSNTSILLVLRTALGANKADRCVKNLHLPLVGPTGSASRSRIGRDPGNTGRQQLDHYP